MLTASDRTEAPFRRTDMGASRCHFSSFDSRFHSNLFKAATFRSVFSAVLLIEVSLASNTALSYKLTGEYYEFFSETVVVYILVSKIVKFPSD